MRNPLARRPGVPEPSRDPRPGGSPRRGGPGVLGWLQRLVVGGVVAVLLGWVLLFYVFAPKLPDPRELRAQSEQPTITVLAADGSVLARRGTEGARFIELGEISPWLVKAVVATEDAPLLPPFRPRPAWASPAPSWSTSRPATSSRAAAPSPSSWSRTSTSRASRRPRRKLQEMVCAHLARDPAQQGRDPHPLPQPRLLRRRRLRRRGGRPALLRQAGQGPDARRGRHGGRPAQGTLPLRAHERPRRVPRPRRHRPRPHGRRRLHHPGAGDRRPHQARQARPRLADGAGRPLRRLGAGRPQAGGRQDRSTTSRSRPRSTRSCRRRPRRRSPR